MKNWLLLLVVLLPLPALAADPSYLTVAGQGQVSAAPDTVIINAGVTSNARTAREALDQNSRAMTQVFAALKTLGIADGAIRTTNLSLQPQYASPTPGVVVPLTDRAITGYRATNNVSVTIEDVSRAGTALDALVTAGANQSGGISYTIRDTHALLDQARADAVKDAMARARIYAAAAGVTLGAIHSITDTAAMTNPITLQGFAAPSPVVAPPPPPVGVGEQTLRVNVTVSWEIK